MPSSSADNQSSITVDAVNQPGASSVVSVDIASTWSDAQEKLLKSIGERSNCMRWLHTQCNLYFENVNFYLTIPNIIISTVNGSITMSISSLFPDSQKEATTIVGLISLFSAILITLNQYIKSQQMTEAHHTASLAYGKLHRTIMNELSLRRDQRQNGLDFLHHIRAEIDHLESTAPSIIPSVIRSFNLQFAARNIEKPEITGDLDEVEINKGIESEGSSRVVPPSDQSSSEDATNNDELPRGAPSAAQPSDSGTSSTSSIVSKLSSLFTSATNFVRPSSESSSALNGHPAIDPKHLTKHLLPENTTESINMSNVVVDMGVATEKDDMSYTILAQQNPPSSENNI
jgi:hypothetical protein